MQTEGEGTMPNWLTLLLRWGGAVLAVLATIALYYVEFLAPTPEAGAAPSAAPVELYWVLLVVGIVAAVIGFAVGRGKPKGGTES